METKMAKRLHETEIWEEDWFIELPKEYQLFWMFLKDNCDHAGLWKPNLTKFNKLFGGDIKLSEAEKNFNKEKERIKILPNGRWFITGFIQFQYGSLSEANRIHKSVIKLLKDNDIDEAPYKGLAKPLQGAKDKDKDKDKDMDKDREVVGEKGFKPSDLKDLWNKIIKESKAQLPECRELSESRISKCRLRISERPLEEWGNIFSLMAKTPFLNGQNNTGWRATFDWIIANKDNAIKVIEGKYEGNGGKNGASNGSIGGQKAAAGKYADFN